MKTAVTFETVALSELDGNTGQIPGLPANPRDWTDKELKNLAKSMRETPLLAEARGAVVVKHDGRYVVLGGNMRRAAAEQLGWGIDIKTQVVLDEADHIDKIIVAIPLITPLSIDGIKDYLLGLGVTEDTEVIINGTGSYKQHSAMADAGTTGRKLAVDFYGGNCRIGGGSPWTKDGTKADLTLNLCARGLFGSGFAWDSGQTQTQKQ